MSLPITLFFPGTLCDERVWLPVWRLLNVDRRYVPLQWASSLDDMLMLTSDRVADNEKVHLVGYSMGGYVASLWAKSNPNKVASLTLIGYNPQGLHRDESARRQQLVKTLGKGQFKPDHPSYAGRLISPECDNFDEVASTIQAMGADLGKATLLAHITATTPRENLLSFFKQAPFPVQLIGASDDEVAPGEDISQIASELSPCPFKLLAATGHMMPLERPAEIASMIKAMVS